MNSDQMMGLLKVTKEVLSQWAPPEITRTLVNVYLNVLAEHSDDEIQKAFGIAVKTLTEWPPPAMINRICNGSTKTDREIGEEIAARIEAAISTWGYTQPEGARMAIGSIGWEVVKLCGGWWQVCDIDSYSLLPSLRKKWRDLAINLTANKFLGDRNHVLNLEYEETMENNARIESEKGRIA